MTTSTVIDLGERRTSGGDPFRPFHPWDRNFFLIYTGLIWATIVTGFGKDMARRVASHEAPYPLVVHFHAAAFVGWLALFTTQVLLIRTGRRELHRRLGFAGVGLALVMLVLGPLTALIVDAGQLGTKDADPAFLSVQFTDMIAFAPLVAAAVAFRAAAAVHKRLILLATIAITNAGFGRWLVELLGKRFGFGTSPLGFGVELYLGADLLVAGVWAYDLATRRRVHPAVIAATAWILLNQSASSWLYFSPAWKVAALHMLGR